MSGSRDRNNPARTSGILPVVFGLSPLDVAVLSWAQIAAFVGALASFRGVQGRARALRGLPAATAPAKVLLIRPCAGCEPMLERALRSSRAMERVAPGSRVVLAVASSKDEAYPVALQVQRELASEGIDIVVTETRAATPNAKSGQLAAVLSREPSSVVVVADSDVELGEAELRGLLVALEGPGVGAAWVPPAEIGPARTSGDRASQALLSASLHAFPVLSGIDGEGMVGKLFAARREALAAVGGFEALCDVLGEDMELARRLHRKGLRIAAVPLLARSLAGGRSIAAVVDRYTRWLQVIRAQRPSLLLSYPLLFFPTLPLLLLALFAPLNPWVAGATAALALSGRLLVAATARFLVDNRASRGGLWMDAMIGDLLLMSSFVRALSRRTVEWRGRTLAITPRGRLVTRAASVALPVLLAVWLGATAAFALPSVGEMGKNVNLEDADGRVIKLEALVGKPILIVYEDKASTKMNQPFKDELSKLAKGDKYKDKVALAAVADLTAYNYWPVKGFVKDSIREESKKLGTTIFCDWNGHVQVSYAFRKKTSSIVLLNKQGRVVFAAEGKMSPEQRKQAIDLLKAEVEGLGAPGSAAPPATPARAPPARRAASGARRAGRSSPAPRRTRLARWRPAAPSPPPRGPPAAAPAPSPRDPGAAPAPARSAPGSAAAPPPPGRSAPRRAPPGTGPPASTARRTRA